MNDDHILSLRNVSKRFGNIIALHDVSISLRRGEVHCLLGDNGAGKSTLIKILSGVHQPTEGEFRVDGDPVLFASPKDALDKGIATVYQDLALIPLMSVARNFFLGREPKKRVFGLFSVMDMDTAAKIAQEKLADMGIKIRDAHHPIGMMSGGEKQCLAIARAIHFGARVLILDEPTSALDAQAEYEIFTRFRELTEQKTAIFISHRFSTVRLADRIFVLEHGQIIESGSHKELLELDKRYAELFNYQPEAYR